MLQNKFRVTSSGHSPVHEITLAFDITNLLHILICVYHVFNIIITSHLQSHCS